ncbi:DNA-binding MarR family transcriptional regulator [Curtobacterium sp. PhB130]|uniref:MarR family winged helix-turn-helix transcriptional regulator n=1 Tax=unclassified Curtobacterium TaxID=257496 RepID=UPI000FB315C2|nr:MULTISPECIES: MarR family transcriptional regulator [unclassified Curtobacterium]ROP63377.1 DNA-binding MarR family transcriptional regulator [Curtobacterium sp. ZW137]ROS77641.1 DNA-binding MarR family transcriptional regulator [Curtobacterium sp. PhB130]TCK66151.1 DNA-binding MarR family transcriptional regulator [Curtobacterium sp. PhB136]
MAGTAEGDAAELLGALDAVIRAERGLAGQLSDRAGIHETGLRALAQISDTGYATATELSGYLSLTSGAVTNLVDRLAAAGLVERRPNPSDRRGSLILLSPAGEAVIADARERYATVLRAVHAATGVDLTSVLNDVATGLLQQGAAMESEEDAAGNA